MAEVLRNLGPDDACFLDYDCLRPLPVGAVLSPWVRVIFNKAGRTISVGNESYPTQHTACIKDFEFGHEQGVECRVTIHDEQGGGFSKFMEDLIKDLKCANGDFQNMDVQFGWIDSSCEQVGSNRASPLFRLMVRDCVCNFSGGKFMYEISGYDITELVFESKSTKTYGGDGNKEIYLTEAITQMFTDKEFPPAIDSVKFLQTSGSGRCNATAIPLKFNRTYGANIDEDKGPKGKWECKNQNKFEAVLEWLAPYVTINNKAIVPFYNSEERAELIFWEDNQPGCDDRTRDWDATKFGTYIVNGGNDSSVLEFNPRFKWTWANLTNPGGNVDDGQPFPNEDRGKQPGLPGCETIDRKAIPSAGSTTSGIADDNAKNTFGQKNATNQTMLGQALQQKALKLFHGPIEADLVVVGEPLAIKPSTGIFKNLHIVFINPYFITTGQTFSDGEVECGEWLATPDLCNPILSNRAWLIKNITHRISEGKFTTTFGVYLLTPGVDVNIGEPLGGAGSGGWVPPKNCE